MFAFRKDTLIINKYRIIRRIGGGSFGEIFLGINVGNGEVSHNIIHILFKLISTKYITWL